MLTLIENGEVYAPEPLGATSVLLCSDRILKIGEIDRGSVEALEIEMDVIDAAGCFLTPGLIDPHQHLLGGSGEEGFSSQTPEISATEIVEAGFTTVVGCLGVDTTMKTMAGLLAKVKGLGEEGLSSYLWSGGYNVPPTSIGNTVRDDILFIKEVLGAGEIAISDERSTDHNPLELARLVIDVHNGGLLSRKAGVTHFHVGTGPQRLKPLTDLLDQFKVIKPEWLYPTHSGRSEDLMREAIDLANRGAYVDLDTADEDLGKWVSFYLQNRGDTDKLTVSSDASITSPKNVFEQVRSCVIDNGFDLSVMLKFVTENTAKVLKLGRKGTIRTGNDADILVLDRDTLKIRYLIAQGKVLLREGETAFKEAFLEESNRNIHLEGQKA